LAERARAANDPDPDILKVVETIQRQQQPLWTPGLEIMSDSRNRTNVVFHEEGLWQAGDNQWSLRHRLGTFHEQVILVDNALGAGWAHPLGEYHFLSLRGMQHFLSAGGGMPWTASAGMRSKWASDLQTDLGAERDLVETQLALSRRITQKILQAGLQTSSRYDWKGRLHLQWAHLSDRNERKTLDAEGGRRLSSLLNLWGLYRFRYDDTLDVRPEYYSPQTDVENQLGLQYGQRGGRWEFNLTYLPGFGSEEGTATLFIQDLEAGVQFKASQNTSYGLTFAHGSTPTYHRDTGRFDVSHRF
jgi:hypothetical protein